MANEKLKKHEIPLDGKLITAVDPSIIGHNFQTLTNLRYYGGRIKGVGGMTKVTSSVVDSTYLKVRSGIHFVKDQPSESHVLVEAYNTAESASRVYANSTAIPNVGDFGTVAHIPSGSVPGRWSQAPDGDVAYCNGAESYIWGGAEKRCSGFQNYDATAGSFEYDYSKQVRNTKTDATSSAVLFTSASGADFYIGSVRPIDGFKLYIGTANSSASTMTVFDWSGTAWVAVTTLSDGTDTGASLAQTGWVTFDTTTTSAKVKYLNSTYLYWYKINVDACSASTSITHVTLNTPFQSIKDIWDGVPSMLDSFYLYENVKFVDGTLNLREDNYVETEAGTYVSLNALAADGVEYFLCGFTERQAGVNISFVGGKENTTAATTLTVKYFNGTAWTTVGTVDDGTSQFSISLGKSGTVTWTPPVSTIEFTTTISNTAHLYYYLFQTNQILSDVQVYHITGIPVQKEISNYKFPLFSNDRLLLCSDEEEKKNSLVCSAEGSSSVWNGEDTTQIEFGDEKELMGGAWLYSQYGSSIFNITLLFKKNETWALIGSGPEDWVKFRVSGTIGCVDPETIKVIDMPPQTAQMPNRNIAVWRGANGIYMSDGRSPIKLSDDIDDVFDKRNSTSINNSVKSFATWDDYHNCYHFCYASGTSTTRDKEVVLDFTKPGWFEIDRTSTKKLQYAIEVKTTSGTNYNYGFIDTGYMLRLEYGNDFDGQDIAHAFQFGDMAPANGSISIETAAEYFGLIAKSKTTTASEITITHYGDGKSTGTSWTKSSAKSGYRLIFPVYHKQTGGGNIFHSAKCVISTNNETYGFEPIYFYMLYKIIRDHITDWRS